MTAKPWGIVLLLGLVQSCQCQKGPSSNFIAASGPGWVSGSVSAAVTDAERLRWIELPGVTVQLRRAADQQVVASVVTDGAGSYVIGPQLSGRYQLCWEKPGFASGCSDELVEIRGTIAYPRTLELTPLGRTLFGRVTLGDGRACNYHDEAFLVDTHARVTVLNAAEGLAAPSVDVNSAGEYIVAGVAPGDVSVQVRCELASAVVATPAMRAEHTKVDVVLPNRSPEVTKLAATVGGRGVYRVRPGDTVRVTAKAVDVDGDALEYRWFASSGTFTSREDGAADWKLTGAPGVNTMYLLVRDGKGGYAKERVEVLTGANPQLNGDVVDDVGAPIADATVSVDGASIQTDAQGRFELSLEGNEERHIVTIAKEHYQTLSRILQGPLVGGHSRFRLSQARTFVVDPASEVSIVDRPKRLGQLGAEISIAPNSLALASDRSQPTAEPLVVSITTINVNDSENAIPGDGSAVNSRGERVRVESVGAVEVEFRDAAGNLYNLINGRTAKVRIPVEEERARRGDLPSSIPVWFYDVASGLWREDGLARLAGDFYEAVVKHFSIIDMGYQGPNVTCARVRTSQMMVSQRYITLPYDIRVDVYKNGTLDISDGGTINDPLSAIVNLPVTTNGNIYTATVTPLNADHTTPNTRFNVVTFTTDTEAAATPVYPFDSCRGVTTGLIQGLGLGGRVDVDFATRGPINGIDGVDGQFLEFKFGPGSFVTSAQYYAKIDPTVTPGPGTVSCPQGSTTVTGAGFLNFFKAGDIIDCDVAGTSHEQRTIKQVDTDNSLTVWAPFANQHLGTVAYNKIGSKTNFAAWKTANGFGSGPPPLGDVEAIYFNDGDLGFGRWMNVKRLNTGSIAFFVSNFKDADKAIAYRNGDPNANGLIATVAMEYSPIGLGDSVTKFYVFNKDGARVDFADLDGNGAKFVPHLCVVCHGGSVQPAPAEPPADLGARFIGFDLKSFAYSSNTQWTRAVQEAQFKTLNQRVRDTVPVGCDPNYQGDYRTICALIDGWYDGGSPTQIDNFVPAVTSPTEVESWQSTDAGTLYPNVVSYCRSCHSTRPANLDWGTYSLFWFRRNFQSGIPGGNIQGRVCGRSTSPYSGRNMPNAPRTWYKFWTSTGPAPDFAPHAPFVLRDGLQITCTPPWPDAGTP